MAKIVNHNNHSTIQIRKDIYFVFGSLEFDGTDVEKIKNSISAFRRYYAVLGEEPPEINMNWREGQEGEWVLSDDFRIVKILRRNDSDRDYDYNKAVIRTCVGTFAVNPKTYFDTDFELHPDRYRVSSNSVDNHVRLIKRKEPTKSERLFASNVAQGLDPTEAYMKTFTTKNESYARDMSKVLMKQERIHSSISEEVESLLEEEGVSKRYIIQKYKELIDDGILDLKNCAPSVRAALKDLADMSAMMPDKTKQSASRGVLESIGDDKIQEIEEAEYSIENELPEHKDAEFQQEFIKGDNVEVGNNIIKKVGMELIS